MSQAGGKKKASKGTRSTLMGSAGTASRRKGTTRVAKEAGDRGSEKKVRSAQLANASVSAGARWTFLTNHAHVLVVLYQDPKVVLREVALQVGITERAVQRIIQDLEEGGFIRREKIGRQNHYSVREDLHLRHPIEAHRTIGDLMRLVMPVT